MKKLTMIILAASLLSCSQFSLSETDSPDSLRSISGTNVQLISLNTEAINFRSSKSVTRTALVRVKNLAYQKDLVIFGEKADGIWDVLTGENESKYLRTAEEGWELWEVKATAVSPLQDPAFGEEFVLRYEVAGEVHWDNNLGENYFASEHQGYYLSSYAPDVLLTDYQYLPVSEDQGFAGYLRGTIAIRNTAPEKDVLVMFTNNDFISTIPYEAQYQSYYYPYLGQAIFSPNAYDVEQWQFSIKVPSGSNLDRVHFYLKYDIGEGTVSFDNNFSHNYSIQ